MRWQKNGHHRIENDGFEKFGSKRRKWRKFNNTKKRILIPLSGKTVKWLFSVAVWGIRVAAYSDKKKIRGSLRRKKENFLPRKTNKLSEVTEIFNSIERTVTNLENRITFFTLGKLPAKLYKPLRLKEILNEVMDKLAPRWTFSTYRSRGNTLWNTYRGFEVSAGLVGHELHTIVSLCMRLLHSLTCIRSWTYHSSRKWDTSS